MLAGIMSGMYTLVVAATMPPGLKEVPLHNMVSPEQAHVQEEEISCTVPKRQ